jgi:PRD1 phage membrane DNA delivery
MFGNAPAAVIGVIGAIIGLAIVAVVVSQRAQTPQVISAGGSALASIINAAVSPVVGQSGATFGTAPGAVV